MTAPAPTRAQVETAIKTALDAISSLGTVYKGFHTLEDDREFLVKNSLISSGSANVFFILPVGSPEREGEAAGEVYVFHQFEIRYWSIRTGVAEWSGEARTKAESVQDTLSGNPAIFRIGGQVQLETPETAQIVSHGPDRIRDGEQGEQMVFLTVLSLVVEARRWDTSLASSEEACTAESANCIIASRVFGGKHQIFE